MKLDFMKAAKKSVKYALLTLPIPIPGICVLAFILSMCCELYKQNQHRAHSPARTKLKMPSKIPSKITRAQQRHLLPA